MSGIQPSLIKELVASDGWCCPYAWLRDLNRRGISAQREANRLGVNTNTVKRWRKALLEGHIDCGKWAKCTDPKK